MYEMYGRQKEELSKLIRVPLEDRVGFPDGWFVSESHVTQHLD